MSRVFVTGIGTDVGKTIVSAIFCEAIEADYWKPIQTGAQENPDVATVQQLISNQRSVCFPSAICLQLPASPNIAAEAENATIHLDEIQFPTTSNSLVIEGAGGILVPINNKNTFADFVLQHQLPVLLVVRNYLGCINHTLLSIEFLKHKGIRIIAGVFNGTFDVGVKKSIQQYSAIRWIDIADSSTIDAAFINTEALKIRSLLTDFS